MRDAPPGLSQFETPFHQPIVRAPIRLQPGADIGADGIFIDLGHVARPQAAHFCSNSSELFARLNQRCVSLSQVKPMPPWICTAWMAVCIYASLARALARCALATASSSPSSNEAAA